MLKSLNCRLCNCSFVQEFSEQIYCNECYLTLDLDEDDIKLREKELEIEDEIVKKKFKF